jgi:hypothetical protein
MKNLLLVILMLIPSVIFSQNDVKIIQKDFESMIVYSRNLKLDEIIELTYPRLLLIYGKDGTKGLLSMMFNGFGIKTIYEDNPINLKMSKITKLKDGSICLGEYEQNMILEFTEESMATGYSQEKMDGYILEKIESKKVRIIGKSYILAINDSHTNKMWKYISYVENPITISGKEFLSQEIVVESKKLKNILTNIK